MSIVHPYYFLGRLDGGDVEVDDYWFLPAANHYAFERLIGTRIDLLMRDEWRHVNEVTRRRLGHELELLAPSHSRAPLNDVDHALELAVMMRAGLGVCMNRDSACPKLACACPRVSDRRRSVHARRLRRVRVELARMNDANAFVLPVEIRFAHIELIMSLEIDRG